MVRALRFFVIMLSVCVVFAFAEENKKEKAKEKDSTPKPIEILAAYVKTAQFKDFPDDVVRRARYLILDNIGCALGGTQMELGKKYLRVSANWKGAPESTVMGTGTRVSCMNAVYEKIGTGKLFYFNFPDSSCLSSLISHLQKTGRKPKTRVRQGSDKLFLMFLFSLHC